MIPSHGLRPAVAEGDGGKKKGKNIVVTPPLANREKTDKRPGSARPLSRFVDSWDASSSHEHYRTVFQAEFVGGIDWTQWVNLGNRG